MKTLKSLILITACQADSSNPFRFAFSYRESEEACDMQLLNNTLLYIAPVDKVTCGADLFCLAKHTECLHLKCYRKDYCRGICDCYRINLARALAMSTDDVIEQYPKLAILRQYVRDYEESIRPISANVAHIGKLPRDNLLQALNYAFDKSETPPATSKCAQCLDNTVKSGDIRKAVKECMLNQPFCTPSRAAAFILTRSVLTLQERSDLQTKLDAFYSELDKISINQDVSRPVFDALNNAVKSVLRIQWNFGSIMDALTFWIHFSQ